MIIKKKWVSMIENALHLLKHSIFIKSVSEDIHEPPPRVCPSLNITNWRQYYQYMPIDFILHRNEKIVPKKSYFLHMMLSSDSWTIHLLQTLHKITSVLDLSNIFCRHTRHMRWQHAIFGSSICFLHFEHFRNLTSSSFVWDFVFLSWFYNMGRNRRLGFGFWDSEG